MVKLPLPPGSFPTLWQQDNRFAESYLDEFPGYYKTADAGYKDEDGYVFVMSRTDDIINVAGHRLSTGGMEEVLAAHPDVAECAVLGIKDDLKGEVPCGFIVLKAGVNRPPEEIEKEIVALVREKIGPVAAFKLAITVARLPKTRSGKILRGTIKKIADGEDWTDAGDHRRPGDFGGDRGCVEGEGMWGSHLDVTLLDCCAGRKGIDEALKRGRLQDATGDSTYWASILFDAQYCALMNPPEKEGFGIYQWQEI